MRSYRPKPEGSPAACLCGGLSKFNHRTKIVEDGMDHISHLPEPILQYILYFLPAKDAARTSILSKKWWSLWNSLPVFDFNLDDRLTFQKLFKSSDQKLIADGQEFVDSVEKSLKKLQGQKATLETFKLKMGTIDLKVTKHIDHWLEEVSRNCIRQLDLEIKIWVEHALYTLPHFIFTAQPLEVLKLSGCKLASSLVDSKLKFTTLRELSLVEVHLDERTMSNLMLSCPAVETLAVMRCKGSKQLIISDLPKLKEVTLHQSYDEFDKFDIIEIEASKLQTLHFQGCFNRPFEIDVAALKHLKELTIIYASVSDLILQNIVSELRFLEKLIVDSSFTLERVKIQSVLLRKLGLSLINAPVEVALNTPNLLAFEYSADVIPTQFSINALSLQQAVIKLSPGRLSTQWFSDLREYLGKFERYSTLNLRIPKRCEFVLEELDESSIPPLSVLNHLEICWIHTPLNYHDVLEGLLWSCHPESLSVDSSCSGFTEFLLEELVTKVEAPCCSSSRVKCWRHYLTGVEIEGSEGFADRNVIISSYRKLLRIEGTDDRSAVLRSLRPILQGGGICFKLKWHESTC